MTAMAMEKIGIMESSDSVHTAVVMAMEKMSFLRFVHTAAATAMERTKKNFHCGHRHNVNTITRFHDTHFFRCCCHHEWVLNPFMMVMEMTQKNAIAITV